MNALAAVLAFPGDQPQAMTALDFVAAALAVYALNGLVTVSHFFKPFRRLFRRIAWAILPFWMVGKFVKYEHFDESPDMKPVLEDVDDLDLAFERKITGYDFIACRMCVGVWITAGLWLFNWPLILPLGIYGAGYFLATQERE